MKTHSETVTQGQEAEELYRILSQDIHNLVHDSHRKYFFTAEKEVIGGSRIDFLNFISGSIYSNPGVLQARIRNITYFGKINNDDGKVTLYRKEDMFADYTNKTIGVSVPVLNKVSEFRAEFSKTGNDWLDTWDISRMKTIPNYIKITFTYEQSTNEVMPERTIVLETTPGILIQ
jgi:hypothetical protein